MSVSAITFDFGQTICELDAAMLAARLGERGLEVDAARVRTSLHDAWRAYDDAIAAGFGGHPWKILMSRLLELSGVPDAERGTAVDWLWIEQPKRNLWRHPIPGMIELCRDLALRGVRLGVVSNSEGRLAELIDEIGLADLFMTVADSGKLGIEKPDPAIFHWALARMGARRRHDGAHRRRLGSRHRRRTPRRASRDLVPGRGQRALPPEVLAANDAPGVVGALKSFGLPMSDADLLASAAVAHAGDLLRDADALVFAAGAGMGVDSGLPDFRGSDGFWRAYPAYKELGLNFSALANPRWFERDPSLAWGFYGHRLGLYRSTRPHAGFEVLLRWAARRALGAFVFTSNVDGQFQKAGFDDERIVEAHGSIHHVQCTSCDAPIETADHITVEVELPSFRAREPLPRCAHCAAILRPNILMFGDGGFRPGTNGGSGGTLRAWLDGLGSTRIAILECGAGSAVPTVRHFSERLARRGASLIRVNLREPEVPTSLGSRAVGLPLRAREALLRLEATIT